jgi:hypothetical protein
MTESIGGASVPKAIVLAEVVNNALYELILRTVKDPSEGPRHYYDLAVIGYSDDASSALSGVLADRSFVANDELARNPLRIDEQTGPDGRPVRKPVFVEPSSGGWTHMCAALDMCGRMLSEWLGEPSHQDSFPPIIVNISDGEATDGDPTVWSQRLRSLGTTDGKVLFFNVSLSAEAKQPIFFPGPDASFPDTYAQQLYLMSSELPPFMADSASRQGIPIVPGARGFVCNADIKALITAIQIGTAPTPAGGPR